MILTKEELLEVSGGAVTASLINSIARGVTVLLELGRAIGSAIRRISSKTVCSI